MCVWGRALGNKGIQKCCSACDCMDHPLSQPTTVFLGFPPCLSWLGGWCTVDCGALLLALVMMVCAFLVTLFLIFACLFVLFCCGAGFLRPNLVEKGPELERIWVVLLTVEPCRTRFPSVYGGSHRNKWHPRCLIKCLIDFLKNL